MRSIAFVNAKGGVGKTTLIYHLASMLSELGVRVLAVDLDPQANLTEMCVGTDQSRSLWSDDLHHRTIVGALEPIMTGGRLREPHVIEVDPRFGLLAGDLGLSAFEGVLDSAWHELLEDAHRARSLMARFWDASTNAAHAWAAEVVLVDLAPSLGPLNRAALVGVDHLIVPLPAHSISLQALRVLGSVLTGWRAEWHARYNHNVNSGIQLPPGKMAVLGYVLLQHSMNLNSTVLASGQALEAIPNAFRTLMLLERRDVMLSVMDPFCLATLKDYRSLVQLSTEAHKPMFLLRSADGAFASQHEAVRRCYQDFRSLALRISEELNIKVPLIEGTVP